MRKKTISLILCMIILMGCGVNTSEDTKSPDNNTTTQNSELHTEQQSEIEIQEETDSQITDSEVANDNTTDVEVENHNTSNGCKHNYSKATCTTPSACNKCGLIKGEALGHDVKKADCTRESTCKRCGKKVGGCKWS